MHWLLWLVIIVAIVLALLYVARGRNNRNRPL